VLDSPGNFNGIRSIRFLGSATDVGTAAKRQSLLGQAATTSARLAGADQLASESHTVVASSDIRARTQAAPPRAVHPAALCGERVSRRVRRPSNPLQIRPLAFAYKFSSTRLHLLDTPTEH
jgi:hypothetical protein